MKVSLVERGVVVPMNEKGDVVGPEIKVGKGNRVLDPLSVLDWFGRVSLIIQMVRKLIGLSPTVRGLMSNAVMFYNWLSWMYLPDAFNALQTRRSKKLLVLYPFGVFSFFLSNLAYTLSKPVLGARPPLKFIQPYNLAWALLAKRYSLNVQRGEAGDALIEAFILMTLGEIPRGLNLFGDRPSRNFPDRKTRLAYLNRYFT